MLVANWFGLRTGGKALYLHATGGAEKSADRDRIATPPRHRRRARASERAAARSAGAGRPNLLAGHIFGLIRRILPPPPPMG